MESFLVAVLVQWSDDVINMVKCFIKVITTSLQRCGIMPLCVISINSSMHRVCSMYHHGVFFFSMMCWTVPMRAMLPPLLGVSSSPLTQVCIIGLCIISMNKRKSEWTSSIQLLQELHVHTAAKPSHGRLVQVLIELEILLLYFLMLVTKFII